MGGGVCEARGGEGKGRGGGGGWVKLEGGKERVNVGEGCV